MKKYRFPDGHVKRSYPTVAYFIYLPKAMAEKLLEKDFTIKLDGERIVLEPQPKQT